MCAYVYSRKHDKYEDIAQMSTMGKKSIDKALLTDRESFLGYGNLESDIWFIGMEEGLSVMEGDIISELEKRFKATKGKEVVDIQDDMRDVRDHIQWFKPSSNAKIRMRPTWRPLIRILLKSWSADIDSNDINECIKKFQMEKWGRYNSNHCLLELLPLPNPNINKWEYGGLGIDYLETRSKYIEKIMPMRIEKFREILATHKPKVVICYGYGYRECWKQLIEPDMEKKPETIKKTLTTMALQYAWKGCTAVYFIIPHPCARIRNDAWDAIAGEIKSISASLAHPSATNNR